MKYLYFLCSLNCTITKIVVIALFSTVYVNGQYVNSDKSVEKEIRILVLHSERTDKPFNKLFNEALKIELDKNYPEDYEIEFEDLDIVKYRDEDYKNALKHQLVLKYYNNKPDLLITTLTPAIEFVKNYSLFKDIPKVIFDFSATEVFDIPNSISISTPKEFAINLEHAISLLPNTENIYVVAGKGDMDLNNLQIFQKQLSAKSDTYKFNYLVDLEPDELLHKVSNLPENSIIYYLTYSLTPSNEAINALDLIVELNNYANSPVFSFMREFIINGRIIGGRSISLKGVAESIVKVQEQVLNNKPIDKIEPSKIESQYVYEWSELKKWNIDIEKLPPESKILNRKYSFFELYKWRIILAILILIIQSLLIFYLISNILRRRKTQEELTKHQEHLGEL